MPHKPQPPIHPFTLSLLNRKGGVGKTSSCFHLSGIFSEKGLRTLLIDMDPQGSLTQGILGVKESLTIGKNDSVAGLFHPGLDPGPKEIIRPTRWKNIALAPSCEALGDYNLPRPEACPDRQAVLADFLREVRSDYDVVLIDCAPNLNLCAWNSLLASHFVAVPLQAEDYGAQGVSYTSQFIELAKQRGNPKLRLIGFLLTMVVARLSIHAAYRKEIRRLYGKEVFAAEMPYLTAYKESISYQMPINFYAPGSAAATATRAIADEILARAREHQLLTTKEAS